MFNFFGEGFWSEGRNTYYPVSQPSANCLTRRRRSFSFSKSQRKRGKTDSKSLHTMCLLLFLLLPSAILVSNHDALPNLVICVLKTAFGASFHLRECVSKLTWKGLKFIFYMIKIHNFNAKTWQNICEKWSKNRPYEIWHS